MEDNTQKPFVFIENVRNEEMRKEWQKILDSGENPFALEHINKYHKNPILMENDHWIVKKNDHPYPGAKHHLLFITKEFCEQDPLKVRPEVHSALYDLVGKITKQLDITGYTVWSRFGDPSKTKSTVLHYHAQLIEPEDGYIIPAWYGIKEM